MGEKNLENPNKRNRDGSKLYLHSFQAHSAQATEAGVRVAYCACPSSSLEFVKVDTKIEKFSNSQSYISLHREYMKELGLLTLLSCF